LSLTGRKRGIKMKDLIIIGAGGFAREVAWLVEDINQEKHRWNLIGYVDEDPAKQDLILNNVPVLGSFDRLKGAARKATAVCAVGNPRSKYKLIHKGDEVGLNYVNLIHPNVRISQYVKMGHGNIICAGNILTVNIKLGNHVILNLDCTVGHDAIIGDYSTILPSVNISGNSIIKEGCFIGTNSAVIEGVSVGEWSIIGAGAVLTKDIPARCTAVGVPAKAIKFHQGEE
jgi:sugar O-acyltransferase (sialic acid O-acetyltransferase NeuD family)